MVGKTECPVIVEPGWVEASVCHLFGKPMFVVPVDCGSHAVLGWVWFAVVVCSLLSIVVFFLLCMGMRLRKPVV
jgi:hypothetical protein